jgi:hypothetical protein
MRALRHTKTNVFDVGLSFVLCSFEYPGSDTTERHRNACYLHAKDTLLLYVKQ